MNQFALQRLITASPWILAGLAAVAAHLLQVSLFSSFAWDGVVPDLVLLTVAAAGLARGTHFGVIVGFAAGVLIDLAPPADHIAGRWALALILVGWIAGYMGESLRARNSDVSGTEWARAVLPAGVATAIATCLAGTTAFAITGLILSDPDVGAAETLSLLVNSWILDVVAAPFVVIALLLAYRWMDSWRIGAGLSQPELVE